MRYAPHKYSGSGVFTRVSVWRSKYPAPGVWQRNAIVAEYRHCDYTGAMEQMRRAIARMRHIPAEQQFMRVR